MRLFTTFLLCLAASVALADGITVIVPAGTAVNVLTNVAPPTPRLPLSVQMRQAAQEARGQAAPWTQRFIVTKVEEEARTREEVFSTNYVVTVAPVTGETNEPAVWGAVKSRTIRFVTPRPTKKGDEFELFPVMER